MEKLNKKYEIYIQTIEATMPSLFLKNKGRNKIGFRIFIRT